MLKFLLAHPGPSILATLESATPQHAQFLRTMNRAATPTHIRWAFQAIATWTPPPSFPLNESKILQLHGTHDHIIPLPKPHPHITPIPGAGHLVNLTHPDEVNSHIASFLSH